jgi:hypothetical protein
VIDSAKAKPTGRLSPEERRRYFYYLSPELLLYGQSGLRNETWSMGCVALAMLLGVEIEGRMEGHPYSDVERKLE